MIRTASLAEAVRDFFVQREPASLSWVLRRKTRNSSASARLMPEQSEAPPDHRLTRENVLPMADKLPILYVKTGCPYCEEAVEFLDEHGIAYEQREVRSNPAAFEEMQRKSGQTKAPTLDWHGKILADFGLEELRPFLQAQNIKLEDS
jgi:glutaredoxin